MNKNLKAIKVLESDLREKYRKAYMDTDTLGLAKRTAKAIINGSAKDIRDTGEK
jgi:hypothetical protein